jgi:hypothetical protein
MPIRPFRKTKRVITRAENISMHEQALASAKKLRLAREEKERLVAEGKLRKEIVHLDSKTTIIRYLPIDEE